MKRHWMPSAVAVLAAALLITPAAEAKRLRCDAGRTEFASGALRVFAIHFDQGQPGNIVGFHTYACLGAHARPLALGDNEWGSHIGDSEGGTPVLVFSGGRYLAIASYESGEGGLDDAHYRVIDLRSRRTLGTIQTGSDNTDGPTLRLSASGEAILYEGPEVKLFAPGSKTGVVLSTPGVRASNAAVSGTTVYWTEQDGSAHAYTLPGEDPPDAIDTIQTPVYAFFANTCDRRSGTTVAQTWQVRVARRGRSMFACLDEHRRVVALPAATRPADLQIAGERWVFSGTSVVDLKTRRTELTLPLPRNARLLGEGTLAWIEAGGRLLAQSPGAPAPTVLAQAGDALSALASSGDIVYWTAAGQPHNWAPAPVRSP